MLEKKALFRQSVLVDVDLIRRILRDLRASGGHLKEDRMLESLEQDFSDEEARLQLDTAIDWGRYAELFAYEDDTGEFSFSEDAAFSTGV